MMLPDKALALALLVVTSLLGCDARVAECNDLIGIINDEQAQLKGINRDDPKALEQLASSVDTTIGKLDEAPVEIAELSRLRDEYKEMCGDLSSTARSIAERLEAGDKARADEAFKKLQAMSPRETKIVNSINAFCQGG